MNFFKTKAKDIMKDGVEEAIQEKVEAIKPYLPIIIPVATFAFGVWFGRVTAKTVNLDITFKGK